MPPNARPVAGQRCRSFTALCGASRAEVEHELYLFLCLRVWACCIGRWYLVDPSLFVLWRVIKAPIRISVPLLLFLGGFLLIQGASELIGTDGITAFIYILAGVR
jgi:hypothetical protein